MDKLDRKTRGTRYTEEGGEDEADTGLNSSSRKKSSTSCLLEARISNTKPGTIGKSIHKKTKQNLSMNYIDPNSSN